MIAYEILVQTIADWKAGARPSAPNVPPPLRGSGAPQAVEEVESGVVDLDEGQEYAEGEYAEGEYAEGEYATETYDDEG
jgi:hypothetical protein